MADPVNGYLDVDTADDFLDRRLPSYQPSGQPISSDEIAEVLAKSERGEITLPELPPPIDR